MKRVNIDRIIVFVLVMLLVILMFYFLKGPSDIKKGQTVKVDYTLYVDDKIFDTSIIEDAKEAGIFDINREYKPLQFVIGDNVILKKFENAVRNMKVDDERFIEVSAVDAYGVVDENKIAKELKKEVVINKTAILNLSTFKEIFSSDPVLDSFLRNVDFPWDLKVIGINGEEVTVENLLKQGDKIILPGATWNSVVEDVMDEGFVIRQYPKVGDRMIFPAGVVVQAIVVHVDEDSFDVDMNHPLAGKDLKFKIILREVNP